VKEFTCKGYVFGVAFLKKEENMRYLTAFILATLIAGSSLYASEEEKVNAIVMLNMEKGLADIQKGFLYNSIDLIQSGVAEVQKENASYQDHKVIKAFLPKNKQQMENLAFITSKRIDNAAEEMKSYLALKQMKKAHSAFSDIVNACTDCHTLIRGW
jgi:predicted CopG family antitoxin